MNKMAFTPHSNDNAGADHAAYADWVANRGGPPNNGDMEARVAKLEAAVDHIQRDIADVKADLRGFRADTRADFKEFRAEVRSDFKEARDLEWRKFILLAGMIIAVALSLAGLMAKGFKWF